MLHEIIWQGFIELNILEVPVSVNQNKARYIMHIRVLILNLNLSAKMRREIDKVIKSH